MKPSIEHIENVFPEEIAGFVSQYYIRRADYHYGEGDNEGQGPTGLTAQSFYYDNDGSTTYVDDDTKMIFDCFTKAIELRYENFWTEHQIYRLYGNCFAPREYANFHVDCDDDSDQFTFLYYPEHEHEYSLDEGGWTEFFIDDKIIGVPPIPNSMVKFTSQILHRASPLRSHTRFTVALKTIQRDEIYKLLNQSSYKPPSGAE
tara:strand:+ start:3741 stop:4349 length:609 start_codon:yes stop_codon:yes gene_type:complete